MTLINWLLVFIGGLALGWHWGCWWQRLQCEMEEQQRSVAAAKLRALRREVNSLKRVNWPSRWGEDE